MLSLSTHDFFNLFRILGRLILVFEFLQTFLTTFVFYLIYAFLAECLFIFHFFLVGHASFWENHAFLGERSLF